MVDEAKSILEFLCYDIIDFEFKKNPKSDCSSENIVLHPNIDYDLHVEQHEDEWVAVLFIDYNVTSSLIDKEGSEKQKVDEEKDYPLYLSTQIVGLFSSNVSDMDKKRFTNLVEVSGLASLFPLLRAHCSAATAALGLNPPITPPLINIHKLVERKRSSESKEGTKE